MLSFDDYVRINKTTPTTIGQQIKKQSDDVMQDTWYNDVQTRTCYLYDYFHDNLEDKEYMRTSHGYIPNTDTGKIKVDLKFIVKEYKSASKDDPEYHIQFPPDFWNNYDTPKWFKEGYEKYGIEFPTSLYVDIPDDKGVYWRWMIFYSEAANQFPKFGVTKCNYRFQWIYDDDIKRYKRQMWGTNRLQNSYTSGVWSGDKTLTLDEQTKLWLPWNAITRELSHDQRMIISMYQDHPLTYIISKVVNVEPKGVLAITLKQTMFDDHTDYVNITEDGEIEMYADYYKKQSNVTEDSSEESATTNEMSLSCAMAQVKIGGGYKTITATVKDKEGTDVTSNYSIFKWSYYIDDVDVSDLIIESTTVDINKAKIKFLGDEEYLGKILTVKCDSNDVTSEIQLNIVSL